MPRPRRPSKIILPKEIKIDLVDKDFEQILKFFPKQNHEVVLYDLRNHFYDLYRVREGFNKLDVKPLPANNTLLIIDIIEALDEHQTATKKLLKALEPCIDVSLAMDATVFDELNNKAIEFKQLLEKTSQDLSLIKLNGGIEPEQAVAFASKLNKIYDLCSLDLKNKARRRQYLALTLDLAGLKFPDPSENKRKFDEHFMKEPLQAKN